MNDNIIREIATKLELPITEIFRIMTEGQTAVGIYNIMGVIIWLASVSGASFACYKFLKSTKHFYDGDVLGLTAVFALFIAFVFLIIVDFFCNGLLAISAPEYSAIKEIARMIKGG